MPIDFGPDIPGAMILFEDAQYPDCVYLELMFYNREVTEAELREVHRGLQKKYKANFPFNSREKLLIFPRAYRFLGIRTVGKKEAEKHSKKL